MPGTVTGSAVRAGSSEYKKMEIFDYVHSQNEPVSKSQITTQLSENNDLQKILIFLRLSPDKSATRAQDYGNILENMVDNFGYGTFEYQAKFRQNEDGLYFIEKDRRNFHERVASMYNK